MEELKIHGLFGKMLSRTADNLYWMARHMERAENTARLLNAQHHSSMLPNAEDSVHRQWKSILDLFELDQFTIDEKKILPKSVLRFMVEDHKNESSIMSCLRKARDNARSVRGGIPTELWEMINSAGLECDTIFKNSSWIKDPEKALDWVKQKSHIFRGVLEATMPRNEFLYFTKIGMFLERADNTARILDLSFSLNEMENKWENIRDEPLSGKKGFAPDDSIDRLGKDYYFWLSVLRSLSAFEIYRQVYRDEITPQKIAELLVTRKDMPRSLLVCVQNIQKNINRVCIADSSLSVKLVGKLVADIMYETVDSDFVEDIRLFLDNFLKRVNHLGTIVSREFLVPISPLVNYDQRAIRDSDE